MFPRRTVKDLAWARPTVVLVAVLALAGLRRSPESAEPVLVGPRSHTHGDLRLHEFASRVYGTTRQLRVLVPAGYDAPENRDRRYPVLYLKDGQNLFDSSTSVHNLMEWRVDDTVQELTAIGRIAPMIVVGIDNAGRRGRFREYFPWFDEYLRPPDPNPQCRQDRRLTANVCSGQVPSWSPDECRLALYAGPSSRDQLFRLNLGSEAATALSASIDHAQAFSRDCRSVAFVSPRNGPRDPFQADVVAGVVTRPTTRLDVSAQASWSPVGRRFLFSAKTTGVDQFYLVGVDGAGLTRLTEPPATPRGAAAQLAPLTLNGTGRRLRNAALGGTIGAAAGVVVCTLLSNLVVNTDVPGFTTCTTKGSLMFAGAGFALGTTIGLLSRPDTTRDESETAEP